MKNTSMEAGLATESAGLATGGFRLAGRNALLAVFTALLALLPAAAHNLDTRATGIFFDKDFVATMSTRATVPEPLVQVNDEFWVIIKTTPGPGTATGVGGYQTFYVPSGVQVIGAEIVEPDPGNPGGFRAISARGQSIIAVGAGSIGAKAAVGLTGYSYPSPNYLGVNELPVTADGISRGTIAGVYADTGIFYSSHPATAFNSYGAPGNPPLINNSGDTVGEFDAVNVAGTDILGVMTEWDSWQLRAFGRQSAAIIDNADQRGNAPWGMASAVAGPQSGYAWSFNYPVYNSTVGTVSQKVQAGIEVGPWQRIKYPGSQGSRDIAGLASTTLGYAGVDASSVGWDFGVDGGLPTSVNAVRFAIGMMELGRPQYARVKVKVLSLPVCPTMYADAFGGDAGGEQGGKDHLWRYFDPTVVSLSPCVLLQKVASTPTVAPNGSLYFDITFANNGTTTLPNVTLTDTLPSGMTFLSSVPNRNSGPNPLVYNLGNVAPGVIKTIRLYVQVTTTGTLLNPVVATSNGSTIATAYDTVEVGFKSQLSEVKTVSPASANPGGTVTYTLTVSNDGNAANGSPLVITEFLPAGFSYASLVSADLNGGNPGPGVVSVNSSNPNKPVFTVTQGINPTKTLVLKFNVTVGTGVGVGTYCNQVSLNFEGKTISGVPEACVTVGGASIGDTVYTDTNGNGSQDGGEPGISGVTVSLYNDVNSNGVWDAGDTLVTTQVTDANGYYLFTGLPAGNYVVKLNSPPSGTNTGNPPGGGGNPTNEGAATVATNGSVLTVDFGYQNAVGVGSIGDQVFFDDNANGVFDGSDTALPNVTVYLYDTTGTILLDTTTTDGSGLYTFAGRAPGNYVVKVDLNDPDIPAGLASTVSGGEYASFTLSGGQPITDKDFPFTQGYLNKVVDKATAVAGETLTFTLTPFLPGPTLLTTATVTDDIPTGTTYVTASANAGGTFSSPTVTWNLGSTANKIDGAGSLSDTASATIAQRGSATVAARSSSGNTLTINKPTGVVSGDVMIAHLAWNNGDVATSVSLSGWTQAPTANVEYDAGGQHRRMTALYRVADGSEGSSFTFAFSGNADQANGAIIAFSGVHSSVFDVTPGSISTGSSTTPTASTITTASANAAVIMLAASMDQTSGNPANNYSSWSTTSPGALTELYDYNVDTKNPIGAAWGKKTIAGATGSGTVTFTGNKKWGAILLALKPGTTTTYNYTTATSLSANRSIVTDADTITVTLTVTATGTGLPVTVTAPALSLTQPSGGTVVFGSASPASQSVSSGVPAFFTYTSTSITPGSSPGVLTIKATPTDTHGSWPQATANTVIVSPQLIFQTTVDTVPGVSVVHNTGLLKNDNGSTLLYTSPQTTTVLTGSIGDTTFYDYNGNGVMDGPDTGVDGVVVTLYNDLGVIGVFEPGTDTVVSSTVTAGGGQYLFTGLAPGNYVAVAEEQTVPAPPASANAGQLGYMVATTGTKSFVTLAPAQNYLDADFGFIEAGLLEGTTFWDVNHNGILDLGDVPQADITVYLYASDGTTLLATTTTDGDGEYSFLVSPGSYVVKYDATDDQWPDPIEDGVGGGVQTTPGSYAVTVAAGQEIQNLNFGRDNSGTIGDTIFADLDGSGAQNGGEPGIQGVTVLLYSNPNGSVGSDGDEVFLESQVTDSAGHYLFVGLPDGNYQVRVDTTATSLPPTFATTPTAEKDGTFNSVNAAVVTAGVGMTDIDFGYPLAPATLYNVSGHVWNDQDGSQTRDAGYEQTTFPGVTVRAQIDTDNDNVADYTLTDTTDGFGYYVFLGIPAGSNVKLIVDEATLPSPGFTQTADPDVTLDGQHLITALGSDVNNQDFGYKGDIRVGNRIWLDNGAGGGVANDGLINGTEPGIDGVTVQVYAADPVWGFPVGSALATTVTADGGYYAFYLSAGEYVIVVPAGNFDTFGDPLFGLYSSGTSNGTSNGVDPDVDATDSDDNGLNAINPVLTGVRTAAFTLSVGGEPTGETDLGPGDSLATDNSANLTVDLGFTAAMPTAVTLASVRAFRDGGQVVVEWETLTEQNTAGFDVYRLNPDGTRVRINEALVAALNVETGGVYRVTDADAANGLQLYELVELETSGRTLTYGPFAVAVRDAAQVRSARLTEGGLVLEFQGEPNTEYRVETTDDLYRGRWRPVVQLSADAQGRLRWVESVPGSLQFFRALRP